MQKNKIFSLCFIGLAIAVIADLWFLQSSYPGYPCPQRQATISFELKEVQAQVACNNNERQQGLMNTAPLNDHEGMLFVFPYLDKHGFWMKNTPVNLSIAFISKGGIINEIREMKAQDETPIIPQKEAKYTLEMREKWFTENHILAGQKMIIKIPN